MNLTDKEKVIAILKGFETRDTKPLIYINPEVYIQHNLSFGDGLNGLKTLITNYPDGVKVNVPRVFQDGNYVFVNWEYYKTSWRVGFDIFRFDKGLIVEHWDNLQERQPLNSGGHSMIDGSTVICDREKTDRNKKIAKYIVNESFINRHFEKLPLYFVDNYIEHNPSLSDNIDAFIDEFQKLQNGTPIMKYSDIHHVLGEGNFVLVASEGQYLGHPAGFFDLFRLEKAKVAEHWITIEEIPPVENRKNKNEKF